MKKRLTAALLCFFALSAGIFGAEITVPSLDLISRGGMENKDFSIRSSMETEIAISGGYKFSISLGLGAEIPDLGKALSYGSVNFTDPLSNDDIKELNDRLNNQAAISVQSINATIREVFGKPLEISFFIGRYDKLGSGDEFQEYFGTEQIGTSLRGFFYYPDGLNNDPFFRFNGAIHSIMGTGLAFKASLGNFIPSLYVYHDHSFHKDQGGSYDPGHYSTDFKLLANGENAKFELFGGFTYANHTKNSIRGGALAWFGTGPLSFLLQAGVTNFELGSAIGINNCYFLMEPRLHYNKFGAILTFFYRPLYFINRKIMDDGSLAEGRADIKLRLFYGDISKSAFEAGVETIINLKVENGDSFKLWVSPFLSTVTTGLQWDFALRFNPLYFQDKGDLMEGFIGIRTSF